MKDFHSIREAAGITGVSAHILRYWERSFPFLKPSRDRRGNRLYAAKDIEAVLRIKELVYGEGYRIRGARKKLRENRRASRTEGRIRLLRETLVELRRIRRWLR